MKAKKQTPARVLTLRGRLKRIGTNEWGKPLVACPACRAPAVVDATQNIYCRACGFTTVGLAGCT